MQILMDANLLLNGDGVC